jgi:hypothetical protein
MAQSLEFIVNQFSTFMEPEIFITVFTTARRTLFHEESVKNYLPICA